MMKIAIIEDEIPAKKHLISLISKLRSDVKVVFEAQHVKGAIAAFEKEPALDLVFMDIQLNDGLSFEIFDYTEVSAPIIFTTAYDQYMLDAFQQNGIDYLLKPIKLSELKGALDKFERLGSHFSNTQIKEFAQKQEKPQTSRILVKKGIHYKSVPVEDIAYFFSEQKVTFLVDKAGNRFVADLPLAELESNLDQFFRLNRKFLASISAVDKFRSIGQGKLQVDLQPKAGEEVVVSQEKARSFRDWMGGR